MDRKTKFDLSISDNDTRGNTEELRIQHASQGNKESE